MTEQRTWFTRLLRRVVDPLYYYLALNGGSGRPSQSKLLTLVGFGTTVYAAIILTQKVAGVAGGSALEIAAVCMMWPLIAALPHGLAGFRAWAESRGGGTADALTAALKAASPEGREKP